MTDHAPEPDPQQVLDRFWEFIDERNYPPDFWHDLSAVGWAGGNIVLAAFGGPAPLAVFYRVDDDGLHGAIVPQPNEFQLIYNVRDPRAYVNHRLSR